MRFPFKANRVPTEGTKVQRDKGTQGGKLHSKVHDLSFVKLLDEIVV